jgi:hypothetical protein
MFPCSHVPMPITRPKPRLATNALQCSYLCCGIGWLPHLWSTGWLARGAVHQQLINGTPRSISDFNKLQLQPIHSSPIMRAERAKLRSCKDDAILAQASEERAPPWVRSENDLLPFLKSGFAPKILGAIHAEGWQHK